MEILIEGLQGPALLIFFSWRKAYTPIVRIVAEVQPETSSTTQ